MEYPFEIIPSNIPEVSTAVKPCDIVQELALQKATDVFERHPDCVVIGCDTVVDLNGEVMGKPHDREDAIRMLKRLSGVTHQVHTGVCVLTPTNKWLFCDSTDVIFRDLTEKEIVRYVDGGGAYGKAGAYGIQDSGFDDHYVGDFDNVVGLPVYRVKVILDKIYKG